MTWARFGPQPVCSAGFCPALTFDTGSFQFGKNIIFCVRFLKQNTFQKQGTGNITKLICSRSIFCKQPPKQSLITNIPNGTNRATW